MGREVPGLRSAVLSPESARRLDEFLTFRHKVRNLYTFNFEPGRLRELLQHLPVVWSSTKADLVDFCNLLQQAGEGEGEDLA
jgi:hypothetical protein